MERVGVVQYDPYNDLFGRPGREAFARLFNMEEYFMVPQSYLRDEEKISLRMAASEIIEMHSPRYLDALIPYTAMTYFDRFLSQRDDFPHENARLFAICCLTIAWKLHNKSFDLSSFLRERNIAYSKENVLQMELQICRGLEWRMRTLTPFCFVDFFTPILNLQPNQLSPRNPVYDLIARSQRDIAFTEYRPSVMAASALIIVSSKLFPAQHSLFHLKILYDLEPLRPLKDIILNCNSQLKPLFTNPSIARAWDVTPGRINESPAGPAPRSGRINEPPAVLPAPVSSADQPAAAGIDEEPMEPFRRRPGKEPCTSYDQEDEDEELKEFERRFMESLHEALRRTQARKEAEEARPGRRPGKEPVTSEMEDDIILEWRGLMEEVQRRDGKEPASSSAAAAAAASSSEIQPASSPEDGDDEIKLGWKELMEEANNKSIDIELGLMGDESGEEGEIRRDGTRREMGCNMQKLAECCATICNIL
ncbi:hypothetical protein OROHE_022382 [Orobanche hederae]